MINNVFIGLAVGIMVSLAIVILGCIALFLREEVKEKKLENEKKYRINKSKKSNKR